MYRGLCSSFWGAYLAYSSLLPARVGLSQDFQKLDKHLELRFLSIYIPWAYMGDAVVLWMARRTWDWEVRIEGWFDSAVHPGEEYV